MGGRSGKKVRAKPKQPKRTQRGGRKPQQAVSTKSAQNTATMRRF